DYARTATLTESVSGEALGPHPLTTIVAETSSYQLDQHNPKDLVIVLPRKVPNRLDRYLRRIVSSQTYYRVVLVAGWWMNNARGIRPKLVRQAFRLPGG